MLRILNLRVVFLQWTNTSYESFTNKVEPSRKETSDKDANTLKSFGDNCTILIRSLKAQLESMLTPKSEVGVTLLRETPSDKY